MATMETTRMSSKGQVVIPEAIRKRLGLNTGTQFVVLGERDVVILRVIAPPSMEQFDDQIAAARKAARRAGVTPSDVTRATANVRRRANGRRRAR
jgi:AbrB family looped-hinge helix DNA binding protein